MSLEGISGVLKKMRQQNPRFSKRLSEARALTQWDKLVGPLIAKHTRVVALKEGILWVEVDHPIWCAELTHRKRQILDRLTSIGNQDLKADTSVASPALPTNGTPPPSVVTSPTAATPIQITEIRFFEKNSPFLQEPKKT